MQGRRAVSCFLYIAPVRYGRIGGHGLVAEHVLAKHGARFRLPLAAYQNYFMSKRVFIVHGWGGYQTEGWFPWLKRELEERRLQVFIPQLPDAGKPRIQKWIPALAEAVGAPDQETYFVGHSMGCQAIARYVEMLDREIGGAVFVAGFFKRLTGLEDDTDVQETDRHWLEAPLDFGKVKVHLGKSIAIFSDDDPNVPLDNQDDFRDHLGSKIIIEHAKRHFSGSDGMKKLPIVLRAVEEITS